MSAGGERPPKVRGRHAVVPVGGFEALEGRASAVAGDACVDGREVQRQADGTAGVQAALPVTETGAVADLVEQGEQQRGHGLLGAGEGRTDALVESGAEGQVLGGRGEGASGAQVRPGGSAGAAGAVEFNVRGSMPTNPSGIGSRDGWTEPAARQTQLLRIKLFA